MANFNDAAVITVFDKVVSFALATGRFDHVNQHEPKNAPGRGLECSVWMNTITPTRSSGLGAVSGIVTLYARIYTNFRKQPYDAIDPDVMAATADIMGAMAGNFDFGGAANVRTVDLLGGWSNTPLSAAAGYVEIDRQMFRIMTVTIPIVINDMFLEAG
jgi:hypothetical protein